MHGLLSDVLVHEEVDPKLKVWAVELRRQRWELALRRDRIPAGLVDGHIVSRAVEMHASDLQVPVRKDDEADVSLTLLGDRRLSFLGNQRKPVALDVGKDAPKVGLEVHSLCIGENVHSTAKRIRRARTKLRAISTVATRHLVHGVLQALARTSGIRVEVRPGGILRQRSFWNRR